MGVFKKILPYVAVLALSASATTVTAVVMNGNEQKREDEADTRFTSALEERCDSFAGRLENLQTEYETACDQKISALRAEFEEEISALQNQGSDIDVEKFLLKTEFQTKLTALEKADSDNDDAIKTLASTYETKKALLEKADSDNSDAIEQLTDDYEKDLAELLEKDTDLQKQITDLKTAYEKKIDELDAELLKVDGKIAASQQTLNLAIEAAKTDYGNKISALQLLIDALEDDGKTYASRLDALEDAVDKLSQKPTYTATFNTNGGSEAPADQAVEEFKKLTCPTAPTKDGYDFAGWFVGDEKWVFSGFGVTENVTLTAKWTPATYNLTYLNPMGIGTATEDLPTNYIYGTTVELPTLAQTGYTFNGWLIDGVKTAEISDDTYGAKTLVADWILDGLTVEDVEGGVKVVDYTGTLTDLVFPEKVGGKPIVSFGGASSCRFSVVNIDLSNCTHLETIEGGAFSLFDRLVSIALPDSLKTIGDDCFRECEKLKSVILPDGITSVGARAFYYCSFLETATLGKKITEIPAQIFNRCEKLKAIDIPSTVTSIGDSAFNGCHDLAEIVLPAGVTTIGLSAFMNCASLVTIVIPDGVEVLSGSTVGYCDKLVNIVLGKGIKNVGSNNFDDLATGCKIFYRGTESEFTTNVSIGNYNEDYSINIVYFEDETATRRWHYVDGVPTVY